jgi:hypothetical protein
MTGAGEFADCSSLLHPRFDARSAQSCSNAGASAPWHPVSSWRESPTAWVSHVVLALIVHMVLLLFKSSIAAPLKQIGPHVSQAFPVFLSVCACFAAAPVLCLIYMNARSFKMKQH